MKERSHECIKSSPVAFLLQGLLSVLWFWFGDFGETSGVERGWGGCCLPRGHVGVSQKTLPVTSGPLRTVNYAHCRNASTQQPNSLRSWKGNTPHTPAVGPPRRHMGSHTHTSTEKQISMCSNNHIYPHNQGHAGQIHTYISQCVCPQGYEVGWFVVLGVRGHRNFTTSGGFCGIWIPVRETAETPNFLSGKYQRMLDLCVQRSCGHVRHSKKMSQKLVKII